MSIHAWSAALATTYLARYLAGEPACQALLEPGTVPRAALAALPLFGVPAVAEGAAEAGAAGDAAATAGAATAAGAADAAADELAACLPRALFVELQPPPPAVARSLRLSAGQPAAMVTVRFDDPA